MIPRKAIALPAGVRLAVSPLSWTNDVLEDLGADISLERCLSDAAETNAESEIRTLWCCSYFSFRPRRIEIVSSTVG